MSDKPYRHGLIGGTLDALHEGHKDYIVFAFGHCERLTIYINDECFVNISKEYEVKSWSDRAGAVMAFLKEEGIFSHCEVVRTMAIQDIKNLISDEKFDVIIVGPERLEMTKKDVTSRKVKPTIIVKDRLTKNGEDISSTKVNLSKVAKA